MNNPLPVSPEMLSHPGSSYDLYGQIVRLMRQMNAKPEDIRHIATLMVAGDMDRLGALPELAVECSQVTADARQEHLTLRQECTPDIVQKRMDEYRAQVRVAHQAHRARCVGILTGNIA